MCNQSVYSSISSSSQSSQTSSSYSSLISMGPNVPTISWLRICLNYSSIISYSCSRVSYMAKKVPRHSDQQGEAKLSLVDAVKMLETFYLSLMSEVSYRVNVINSYRVPNLFILIVKYYLEHAIGFNQINQSTLFRRLLIIGFIEPR